MDTIKTKRAIGFLIDYAIWYILMILMIVIYFLWVEKLTPFSGNLPGYAPLFDGIIKKPSFLILYLGSLFVYEIIIPLCFGGQSISKMILHTEIEPFTVRTVLLRGLLKIFTINPCGVLSFLLALILPGDAVFVSDILWVLLGVNIVVLLWRGRTLYDMISKTNIKKKEVYYNEICYSE